MTRQRRTQEEARGCILAAAEEIVRRQGVARLTIDAVAAQAGMSKGGTLHHFPSKDALITGMIEHKASDLRATIADHEARYGATPHARILGALHHARHQCIHDRELPRAILVAAAERPELMNALKTVINDVMHAADHAEDADMSLAVIFATHGLLMSKMLNFDDLSEERTARLFDYLERLIAKKTGQPTPTPGASTHTSEEVAIGAGAAGAGGRREG